MTEAANMASRPQYVIYATIDDERMAREWAERLWDEGRKAVVERVTEMHMRGDPLAPRTTNRFAVVAEPRRLPT